MDVIMYMLKRENPSILHFKNQTKRRDHKYNRGKALPIKRTNQTLPLLFN